jgi:hypothetical protein
MNGGSTFVGESKSTGIPSNANDFLLDSQTAKPFQASLRKRLRRNSRPSKLQLMLGFNPVEGMRISRVLYF